jgi:CHAT domain-containing protein
VQRWLSLMASVAVALSAASCHRTRGAPLDFDAELATARATQVKLGPRAAIPAYERILAAARSSHSRKYEALALGQMGTAYKNLSDYTRAMELQQQALAIKRELGDEIEIAKTLSNMGLVEYDRGDCGKALGLYAQSLDIFVRQNKPQFAASVLNNQGLCYDALGDFPRSTATYQRALALHREQGNETGESESLGNLGGVALLLGRYDEAVKVYEQSLTISARLDNKQSMALDLINLGLARLGTGNFKTGRGHLERARGIARDAGLLHEEADATRDLSTLFEQTGRYDEARTALNDSARVYAKAGSAREQIDTAQALGLLDLDTGDMGRAVSALEGAAADAERLRYHSGLLAAQLALAAVELRRHNTAAAAAAAERAHKTAMEADDAASTASALTWLSRIRLSQGQEDAAMAAAKTALVAALKTDAPLVIGEARVALAETLLAAGRGGDAVALCDAVLRDEAAGTIPDLVWRASFGRGRALESLGRLDQALADYLHAVDTIERVRAQLSAERARTGFLDDKREVYAALVRLLLRMGRTKEAFQAAERLRAEGYREMVERSLALGASQGAVSASLLARIRHLQAAMDAELRRPPAERRGQAVTVYRDELREAEDAWSAAVSALTGHAPLAAALRPATEVSVAGVQQWLPARSALLEYVVDHDRTTAFVLRAGSLRARTLPVGEVELRTHIELLRGLLARQEPDGWQQVAQRLDHELLDPLRQAGWLAGISRLYIVPHAELNYLPFAVLRHEARGGARVLVDDMALIVLPAASALMESRPRPSPPGSLLALAPSRTKLQFAREEVESIARLFPASREVFVGKDATEARFKQDAGRYRVLHLATHGFFNRLNPLFSGVELEPSADEDGQLQVYEILGLPLAANLVTLSACDTALGGGELSDLPTGEELIGLTRAFLSAGGSSVLASLWEIDDRSTAELIAAFYRAARTRPFPEALAQVQRERAHRSGAESNPWHWAAFTIAEGRRPGADDRITSP